MRLLIGAHSRIEFAAPFKVPLRQIKFEIQLLVRWRDLEFSVAIDMRWIAPDKCLHHIAVPQSKPLLWSRTIFEHGQFRKRAIVSQIKKLARPKRANGCRYIRLGRASG